MRRDEYRNIYELEERFWWYIGMRSVTAAMLERYLPSGAELRILDLGCGTGYSLSWLSKRYGIRRAYGVDVSADAAAFWKSRGVETAAIASACELPFAREQFDLVTCFDVLYQFSHDRFQKALSEIHRVLRPGGLFFIREPAYQWMRGSHDIAVGTAHRYTAGELRAELSATGFSPLRVSYANSLLFLAAVPHRLISRLAGGDDSDVRPINSFMNRAFQSALNMEARLLRRVGLPFGLSVMALSRRP
ncbi:MAG TPA: class I SAM-dependent methyltransferase [Blastocatellia bacterium]